MSDPATANDIIRRAFALARQSGKADWWAMTTPVLKNRLLLVTNNTFSESDFGATSYRDFLDKNSNILRIDETHRPGLVILKDAAPPIGDVQLAKAARTAKVRSDLWRAILDYSSNRRYVWDANAQIAVPAEPDSQGPFLPTISEADLDRWRTEFLASAQFPDLETARRAQEWCQEKRPTAALPTAMRPGWNRTLQRNVQHRLQKWFRDSAINPPAIIQESTEEESPENQLEVLRKFVIGCVSLMTKQELRELRISPVIALRMQLSESPVGPTDEN